MPTATVTTNERRAAPTLSLQTTSQTGEEASAAISVSGLVKRFGATRALDGLDLMVRSGEVHGFLGPNGAGKTTTVRVLLGLLRKDGGEAAVLGGDPWREAVALHRRLAYVPGEVNLWPNLTGGEVIDLLGTLRGGLDPGRRADLLDRFQLDPTKKIRAYSKGNRQKVALVAAFASDVENTLLDELTGSRPADGDRLPGRRPRAPHAGHRPCQPHPRRGRGAVRSRHDHPAGRATESGTFDELRHLTRTTVVVETANPIGTLSYLPGVHDVSVDGTRAQFSVDTGELNRILEHLVEYDVRSLTSSPPTLEELFLRHYGDDLATRNDLPVLVGAR
jgi:ABC-2 type transport system ATP-binding protein